VSRTILERAPDLLTEREFSTLVADVARLGGWKRYHTFDSRRSHFGFPDWVFCRNGILIFAELKSESGRLSDEQRAWIDALQMVAHGPGSKVLVFVWRPSSWDEIVEILTGRRPA
jgi:hypothetical protein